MLGIAEAYIASAYASAANAAADYAYGRSWHAGLQNAYVRPPPFPRSEHEQDDIMLRRYEARRQIKQAHRIRIALWVIFTPIVICVLIKAWSLSIQWVLS